MTSRPPTEPLSRSIRLLGAVIITLVALVITWLADQWIRRDRDVPDVPHFVE